MRYILLMLRAFGMLILILFFVVAVILLFVMVIAIDMFRFFRGMLRSRKHDADND